MPVAYTWHEQQLLKELAEPIAMGKIEIVHDADLLFRRICAVFPIRMNRIDWPAVPNASHLEVTPDPRRRSSQLVEPARELREFWQSARQEGGIDDSAMINVVGDALVTFALRLSAETLTAHLVDILSVPHHTYIIPDDVSWCFNYAFEDNAYFAVVPADPDRP